VELMTLAVLAACVAATAALLPLCGWLMEKRS
jgi:hypothetical protein